MKFFGWMQSKFNGGNSSRTAKDHMKQEAQKEEWAARGFLAIGTFGNNDIIAAAEENDQVEENGTTLSASTMSEFTSEEIGKLQKELTKLLSKKKPASESESETTTNIGDLPLDRFLNCPSSLEIARTTDDKEELIDRTIRVILGRCKDIVCMENTCTRKQKPVSTFLFKKMFACSSGLPPPPPPPRPAATTFRPLPQSRMERLLRAMLKNKMNSCGASSAKKLIDNRQSSKKGKGKATEENNDVDANDGSKWVKTDSEYIVLEI